MFNTVISDDINVFYIKVANFEWDGKFVLDVNLREFAQNEIAF